MRRWFVLFLLCLLPFQLSWAAASAYCQHERDPQPSHWGHHDSTAGNSDRSHSGEGAQKNASTQPNAVAGEGAVCHGGCVQHAESLADAVLTPAQRAQTVRALPAPRFASHIAEVPLPPARIAPAA